MCLAFIPKGRCRFTVAQQTNNIARRAKASQVLQQRIKSQQQLTLADCFGIDLQKSEHLAETIDATGDPLIAKKKGIVRFAFQNINGISLKEGVHYMPEIATIGALQMDVTAFAETTIHWNQSKKDKLCHQLYTHLGHSKIVCASEVTKRVSLSCSKNW